MATPKAAPTTVENTEYVETTAATEHGTEDAGLLATLGIEGKLFAAQLLNFAIVAVVLWKFAYKPLLKVMDERATIIAKGLKDADASANAKKIAEEAAAAIVAEARTKARDIVDDATKRASAEGEAIVTKARTDVANVVEQGKEQIRAEKVKMMADAKTEIGTLVALAAERVLKEKMDDKKDAKLIADAVAAIEKAV